VEGPLDLQTLCELESILHSLITNDTSILDGLAQLLSVMQQVQLRSEESNRLLREELRRLREEIRNSTPGGPEAKAGARGAKGSILLGEDEFSAQNPEAGLLAYLFTFLPDRVAIDVGANAGAVSERLLKAGYSVYAFEPHGPSFQALREKLGGNESFHAFDYAIGAADGTMDLHIAADLSGANKWDTTLFHSLVQHPMLPDLQFADSVPVRVRSLDSLCQSGEIPARGGVLKIDAEGFDLEVMRGMGKTAFSVVLTEFWDPVHPFGREAKTGLADQVAEMRARGYERYIVIYRLDEVSTLSFYCNRCETVPKSWGNAVFFADAAMFSKAYSWCEEVLVATLYR